MSVYMLDGVVYEFIAVPCGTRYTTPLGLHWGPTPWARVYRSTRLHALIEEGVVERMILYSPLDPRDFILSIIHELDALLGEECRPPRPYTVAYECTPRIKESTRDYIDIACPGRLKPGAPAPYTRLYGAIVEALVLASKLGAGVVDEGFARACMQCCKWTLQRVHSGGQEPMALRELLQSALKRLCGDRCLEEGL
ncbi:MAG: hypothetical protein GSR80_000513 [Desulfurococcales archaeon]|nr:hypothetical protein [Desulfurococcales archaeon]